MKPLFSQAELRQMDLSAKRGKWIGLVKLTDIPAFAAWLSDDLHGWQMQSPDCGEALRAYRHGRTISVRYDGRRTICGRCVMALYLTFQCFKKG